MPYPSPSLTAALRYAARGWSVLPVHWPLARGGCSCGDRGCPSPGKHPLLPKWERYATNDPGTLASWWAQAPEANVGIACGASGLAVVDIDGRAGIQSLRKLQVEHGKLPLTLRFRTGSGGLHLVYRDESYAIPGRIGLLPGIDIRGQGGQIVAPPSLHQSGRRYEALAGPTEPAELPRWLATMIRKSPERPTLARRRAEARANGGVTLNPEAAPQGGRRYVGLGDPGVLAGAIRRKLAGRG
jgi:hypothetical protein